MDLLVFGVSLVSPFTRLASTGCRTKRALRLLIRARFRDLMEKDPNRLRLLCENLSNLPGLAFEMGFPLKEFSPPLRQAYSTAKNLQQQLTNMGSCPGAPASASGGARAQPHDAMLDLPDVAIELTPAAKRKNWARSVGVGPQVSAERSSTNVGPPMASTIRS